MDNLTKKVINWLKTKTKEDIDYVKKNKWTIFTKHIGITEYDVEKIVEEPEKKIKKVERSLSHPDTRLLIIRAFSKKCDTEYIILDPFYKNLEEKWKGKVAIVTVHPIKSKQ